MLRKNKSIVGNYSAYFVMPSKTRNLKYWNIAQGHKISPFGRNDIKNQQVQNNTLSSYHCCYKCVINSTWSDYTQTRHTRREAGIQRHGRQAKTIHGAWIPAIPAEMTMLENSNHVI